MSFKPSKFYDFTVPASGAYTLTVAGDYFKVMACSGPLSVKSDWGELRELTVGQGLEDSPFQRLYITNETAQSNTIRLFIGDEKFIDGVTGAIAISSTVQPLAVLDNQQKTVTNASAQLLEAKPGREYLLIQNKDATGSLFLSFGKAATTANGVRVIPGGAFELTGTQTEQAIFAIGDIANNANVVTVEG